MSTDKTEIRKTTKQKLLSISNRKQLEKQICKQLLGIIGNHQKILFYQADKYEVDLSSVTAERKTNQYYFPRIVSLEEKSLEFIKPEKWELGPYSIWQPKGNERILPKDADFCIVPALGFNQKGYRLGRGGGFYDRNLGEVSPEKLIGLTFQDVFPLGFLENSYDIRVKRIITESQTIRIDSH